MRLKQGVYLFILLLALLTIFLLIFFHRPRQKIFCRRQTKINKQKLIVMANFSVLDDAMKEFEPTASLTWSSSSNSDTMPEGLTSPDYTLRLNNIQYFVHTLKLHDVSNFFSSSFLSMPSAKEKRISPSCFHAPATASYGKWRLTSCTIVHATSTWTTLFHFLKLLMC